MQFSQAPLVVQNLVKRYGASGAGGVLAVNGVSFSLNPGEVFGLLGPNGAGKTSIISTIVTLERPTEGAIRINGYDNQTHPREAKQCVGFVPQEIVNHGYFNVEEILDFHSGYYGIIQKQERIEYLLDSLGLKEHRYKKVKQLSGGMKRRLLIAKALVHSPQLLLLDEPTAGVDIELRAQLWEFVKELKEQGVTILLTTHYLEEAQRLCDRVGILHEGRLKAIDSTGDFIRKLTERRVTLLRRSRPGTAEVFRLKSGQSVGDLLREQKISIEDIMDLNVEEGTLEEAFRHVLSGEGA